MYDDDDEPEGPKSSFTTYLSEGNVHFNQGEYKKALDSYSQVQNESLCVPVIIIFLERKEVHEFVRFIIVLAHAEVNLFLYYQFLKSQGYFQGNKHRSVESLHVHITRKSLHAYNFMSQKLTVYVASLFLLIMH